MVLELFLLFSLCLILIFLIVYWFIQIQFNYSPDKIGFLPTYSRRFNRSLVQTIEDYYPDQSDVYFVEFGAGLANVAGFVSKKLSFKEVIAVELEMITMFFAKILKFLSRTRITLIQEDIFNYNIPKKSVVYAYLGHSILKKLYKQGHFNDCLLISTSFVIDEVKPTKTIKIGGFYQHVFIYNFLEKKV